MTCLFTVATQFAPAIARAQDPSDAPILRVCADPDAAPFSSRDGSGFHNRVAQVLADALGRKVETVWHPYGIGFLRQTLLRGRCDLVLEDVRPHTRVARTAPFFTAGYAVVAPSGTLANLSKDPAIAIDAPELSALRLGVVTGSAPAAHLARLGVIGLARPYRPILDRRHAAPLEQMISDMLSGETGAILVWAPLALHALAKYPDQIDVRPLLSPAQSPALQVSVGLATRAGEGDWQTKLQDALRSQAERIDAILIEFGLTPVR